MTINSGYRSKDMPVAIGGTFMSRVQSHNLNRNIPVTPTYEMGNQEAVGIDEDINTYPGDLNFLPIDNQIEAAFLSLPDITNLAPKGLLDFANAAGTRVGTPKDSISGAKLVTITYSGRVGGQFTGAITFEGSSFSTGEVISVTEPTGVGAYRMPSIVVTLGGTQLARAQGFNVRGALSVSRLMEISNSSPVSIDFDTPGASASVDFVESDAAAGNVVIPINMPVDMVITIGSGSGKKRITVTNVVSSRVGSRSQINGYSTRAYEYVSKGDSTYGGLKIDKTP